MLSIGFCLNPISISDNAFIISSEYIYNVDSLALLVILLICHARSRHTKPRFTYCIKTFRQHYLLSGQAPLHYNHYPKKIVANCNNMSRIFWFSYASKVLISFLTLTVKTVTLRKTSQQSTI